MPPRRAMVLAAFAALPAFAPPAPDVITVASARGTRRVAVVTERGFPALAAPQLAAVLALETAASPPGTATLRVGGRAVAIVLEAANFRVDGGIYTLAAAPYVARDSLFLPLQFVAEQLPRLVPRYRWDAGRDRLDELPASADSADRAPAVAARPAAAHRRRVIAIDAGHGGVDVGMTGPIGQSPYLQEKDVTLGIARALARELEARGCGTVLTRDRDTLIALGDRGKIAGRSGADLFVSVHVNAANPRWRDARDARGFETYFLAEARTEDARRVERMENSSVRFETTARTGRGDPMTFILHDLAQNEHLREASRLAELVQESLHKVHPGEGRGVKQAGFMVLATSYMPAILVETGFGSNAAEARYLTGAAGQQRLARAIADGIVQYLAEYERRVAGAN
jgi:N-acetylmuramoyl-L-alanine amidase